MCQNIYISSKRELPEIEWDENSTGFYIKKVNHPGTLEMLKPILHSEFIYEALSHMGCSCGLCYAEWSRKDEKENHSKRVKDVRDFANYLDIHKQGNKLQIFSTGWVDFPDVYEQKEFKTSDINQNEFDIDEMVILDVM